jgi:AraC-like DNA-binding protein
VSNQAASCRWRTICSSRCLPSLSKGSEPGEGRQAITPLRVKQYIDQRLADPALGPGEVAAAFGISTRYLHRLFEREHETVAQYIRDRRLERCRLLLLDP